MEKIYLAYTYLLNGDHLIDKRLAAVTDEIEKIIQPADVERSQDSAQHQSGHPECKLSSVKSGIRLILFHDSLLLLEQIPVRGEGYVAGRFFLLRKKSDSES